VGEVQVCVDKITKRFGDVVAVDEMSLSVERGQFLTLLGPSGCGKTTLLRMIAGFEEPTTGRVFIGGTDVTYLPPHRRPANMVFQRYALFPHLSVFENVAFGLRLKKLSDSQVTGHVEQMLALVQLEGYGGRHVNQLSGGQAQRVALARAIVNEPDVLLLDEPLGALDLKIRQQMQVELKLLHAELGMTFVYVTHDQEEAMTISDRIVVMRSGRVVQDGSPEEIYSNPANAFVADFIGHSNLLLAEVTTADPTRCRFLGSIYACRRCPGLEEGQEVKVLLRPETIMLFSDPPDGLENWVEGEIVDSTFKGPYVDYLLDVDTCRLKVHQPIHEGVRVFARGEQLHAAWSPDDAHVLGY
jgi:spermidine/putrescine transport system ATP-binding protein